MDRRHALARGHPLPDRTVGAALFADISGFTPLTEALARTLGPRLGAEELTRQLNRVYDALIAQVNRYGGSVIGFAGDAITCWFGEPDPLDPQRPQRLLHPPLCATACALAMQQAMQQFTTVELSIGETVELVMKAGVASGPARRFLVGDPSIQLVDALAGETVARMAAAEHMANRGEVVIDAQTAAHLEEGAQVVEWRTEEETGRSFAVVDGLSIPIASSPWSPLDPQALCEEQVHPWLLPTVYEWLREGVGEFLELRPAVALFVRFEGIDYDRDEAAGEKLDAYIRWAQGVLARYEGSLLQLTIGDKGSSFYAAFGAPIAHEDDARRAAIAALELCAPPTSLGFIQPVQIGLAQGTMRAGTYGGKTRCTYGVISDDVNLAARLMQRAAPGEVLVSSYVQSAAGDTFAWEELAPIQVRGKSKLVPVARLIGTGKAQTRQRTVTYTSVLVGREAELEQLVRFLGPLFENQFAGMAYVYGEAGVGKSRLVHELHQHISDPQSPISNLQWFTCPAEQILRQSLYPFRYFLREYFDQYVDRSEEENKAYLDQVLDELIAGLLKVPGFSTRDQNLELVRELERTRSFLGAMVDLHWEGSLYEQLEPRLRFGNTLATFKALIMAESLRRPVVLHIEDAHWLDVDSQELLKTLTRGTEGYPFAVLLTGRYGDDGSRFSIDVGEDVPQQTLDLKELLSTDVRALAAQTLEGEISDDLAALLVERTNGNPLFVEQLALDMRERGLVSVEDGEWRMASRAIERVPASVNSVLIARLDRLAARVKVTVQTASVLGYEFQRPILAHMLQDDEQLPLWIQQAESRMIWSALGEMRYLFRHTIMRDAAYNMQLQAHLREMHRLAGEAMVQVYGRDADLESHYADLAHHYGKAGDDGQALLYARLAGQRAAAQFANHEAIDHMEAALQSAERLVPGETLEQRQEIHTTLGRLLTSTAQYDHALDHLGKALELAIERGDPDAQAQASRWSAEVCESRSEYASALGWVQRGLDALEGRDDRSTEAAELTLIAGLIHTRQGDYDSALERCQHAMRLAQRAHGVTVLARSSNLLGLITRLRGQATAAIQHFRHAFDLYQRAGDLPGQATSHNLIANALADTGQWQQADDHYHQARQVFDQIGDVYNRAFADNNLGEIRLKRGELENALASYQTALQTMERIGGSRYVLGVMHMNLGATFIRRGEIDTARTHLRTSQEYFEQVQARDWLPELHCHWAEAALRAGEPSEAEKQGRQALILARELEMQGEEGKSLCVLGESAIAQGQFSQARACLDASISLLRQVGDEYANARSQLALARLHATQGDQTAALTTLKDCMPIFERLEAALDLDAAHALRQEIQSSFE
jgi:class 3 adenylate cyclase/predicted ATPase